MAEKKKKKKLDVGRRGPAGADYFQPSTGKSITREQYIAGGQPRTYAVNQQTGLTKEEYEKTKRTPALMQETYRAPENIYKVPIEQRTPEQREITGEAQVIQPAEELSAKLGQKIEEQPSLAPTIPTTETGSTTSAFLEGVGRAGNLNIFSALKGDQMSPEEAQLRGASKLGVGAAALGLLTAYPLLVKASAGASVTKSMTAKLGIFSSVVGGLTAYFIGRQVTDYRGGELDTMREMVGSFTEDGERLQSLVLEGMEPETALLVLEKMSDEVDYAESVIKEIGNKNIQFRYEKEYLADMQTIRSARLALQRRIRAVINIAQTGSANLDPESLLYTASEFKK